MPRPLRTQLDVIKVYWSQYKYFSENIGSVTEHNVLINNRLVDITLKRLLELLELEWSDYFNDEYKESRRNGQAT